jgi:hypothetical protein
MLFGLEKIRRLSKSAKHFLEPATTSASVALPLIFSFVVTSFNVVMTAKVE